MRWPWVSRRKHESICAWKDTVHATLIDSFVRKIRGLEAANTAAAAQLVALDDQVDFWRESYKRINEENNEAQEEIKKLEKRFGIYDPESEKGKEADATSIIKHAREARGSWPRPGAVPEVRAGESVRESHTVDTGRLDRKATPHRPATGKRQ